MQVAGKLHAGRCPRCPHRAGIILFWVLASARVASASPDSTIAEGAWGPMPAPADSVTARMGPRPVPAWEWPGRVVYHAVGYPLSAVKFGAQQVTVVGYESGLIGRLMRLPGPYGPYALTFSVTADPDGYDFGASAGRRDFLGTGGGFRASGLYSTRDAGKVSAGYVSRDDRLSLGGRYSRRPEARYFGLGASSSEDEESFYTQELTWGGIGWRRPLSRNWNLRWTALYSEIGTRGPGGSADEDRELRDLHPLPAGYGERSRGATFRLGLLHDSTRETGRPEGGGVLVAEAARFVETTAIGPDFWILRGEAQRFLPLPRSKQVLAVRATISALASDDLAGIPFQRLLTNDEPDQLRGYRDSRWRDRGLVIGTVEYRWPFWALMTADGPGADITLFTDVGQVFQEFDQIGGGNLTQSYGVGLRVIGLSGLAGRFEVAWSEEEWTVRLKGDQLFHLGRRGVYDGNDQVALR